MFAYALIGLVTLGCLAVLFEVTDRHQTMSTINTSPRWRHNPEGHLSHCPIYGSTSLIRTRILLQMCIALLAKHYLTSHRLWKDLMYFYKESVVSELLKVGW